MASFIEAKLKLGRSWIWPPASIKENMSKNDRRLAELEQISDSHDGILHPEHVIEHAKDPGSSLHDYFEWDDTKAAREHRMWQARHLISITYIKRGGQETPAFIALVVDDKREGGYRQTSSLLKVESGREAILRTALWELQAFRNKYKDLEELVEVFRAANALFSGK